MTEELGRLTVLDCGATSLSRMTGSLGAEPHLQTGYRYFMLAPSSEPLSTIIYLQQRMPVGALA